MGRKIRSTRPLAVNILALLALNMCSGILIKTSPEFYNRPHLLVLLIGVVSGFYFARTLVWLHLGRHYQLSYVYPFLGINYVLSLFVGMAVFNEPFEWQRLMGALVVVFGMAMLSQSSHRHEPDRNGTAA